MVALPIGMAVRTATSSSFDQSSSSSRVVDVWYRFVVFAALYAVLAGWSAADALEPSRCAPKVTKKKKPKNENFVIIIIIIFVLFYQKSFYYICLHLLSSVDYPVVGFARTAHGEVFLSEILFFLPRPCKTRVSVQNAGLLLLYARSVVQCAAARNRSCVKDVPPL